jgi:hypothetical protein
MYTENAIPTAILVFGKSAVIGGLLGGIHPFGGIGMSGSWPPERVDCRRSDIRGDTRVDTRFAFCRSESGFCRDIATRSSITTNLTFYKIKRQSRVSRDG